MTKFNLNQSMNSREVRALAEEMKQYVNEHPSNAIVISYVDDSRNVKKELSILKLTADDGRKCFELYDRDEHKTIWQEKGTEKRFPNYVDSIEGLMIIWMTRNEMIAYEEKKKAEEESHSCIMTRKEIETAIERQQSVGSWSNTHGESYRVVFDQVEGENVEVHIENQGLGRYMETVEFDMYDIDGIYDWLNEIAKKYGMGCDNTYFDDYESDEERTIWETAETIYEKQDEEIGVEIGGRTLTILTYEGYGIYYGEDRLEDMPDFDIERVDSIVLALKDIWGDLRADVKRIVADEGEGVKDTPCLADEELLDEIFGVEKEALTKKSIKRFFREDEIAYYLDEDRKFVFSVEWEKVLFYDDKDEETVIIEDLNAIDIDEAVEKTYKFLNEKGKKYGFAVAGKKEEFVITDEELPESENYKGLADGADEILSTLALDIKLGMNYNGGCLGYMLDDMGRELAIFAETDENDDLVLYATKYGTELEHRVVRRITEENLAYALYSMCIADDKKEKVVETMEDYMDGRLELMIDTYGTEEDEAPDGNWSEDYTYDRDWTAEALDLPNEAVEALYPYEKYERKMDGRWPGLYDWRKNEWRYEKLIALVKEKKGKGENAIDLSAYNDMVTKEKDYERILTERQIWDNISNIEKEADVLGLYIDGREVRWNKPNLSYTLVKWPRYQYLMDYPNCRDYMYDFWDEEIQLEGMMIDVDFIERTSAKEYNRFDESIMAERKKIAEMLAESDWKEPVEGYTLGNIVRTLPDWYDNYPIITNGIDEEGDAWIGASNSESCFDDIVYVKDSSSVSEIDEALTELVCKFIDYYDGLDDETLDDCEKEGSCCIDNTWCC